MCRQCFQCYERLKCSTKVVNPTFKIKNTLGFAPSSALKKATRSGNWPKFYWLVFEIKPSISNERAQFSVDAAIDSPF